jgi:two-component system, cell cycle sensor histidine kinase and response regulator CckA
MAENSPPETATKSIQDSDPAALTADQWQRIFDAVPVQIALINKNHRVITINKAMADRLGYTPREATGRFCYEIVHGLSAPPDFCPHSKTIGDLKTASVEVAEERLNGIFQITTTPFFDYRGQLNGSIHIARDITLQKQKEEALRESEEKHRALIAGLPDIIMRIDREGRHLFVSENVRNASGIPASAFIGKTHREMGFDDQMCIFWEQTRQKVFDSGLPLETEFQFPGPEEKIFYNWLAPEYDANGDIRSVLAISRDITDRKQMEQALRASETKFRGYIENSPHGIFIVDRNSRCIEVNPAATRITGYTEAELLSMHIPDILTPESREAGMAHFQEVLQTGLALGGEMAYRHAGGDIRHFRISAARVSEDRFIGFAEDITTLKRAEAERENLQAQLLQSRKMDAVGRLAGGMAHDFNNMLGTIFANAEAAMDDLEPTDPVFECLADIHAAANRSADMIRQLLAFARQQPISPKRIDLNHSIESMLKMLRRLIGEHIQLDWRPGPDLRPVNMDTSQVDQILANLCINARDAISGNGRIIIETDNIAVDEKHRQDRPYLTRGDFVTLSVGDNGAGMDAATREHIFEPFFTTKKIGKGTGLGLATVYGIVKQNAGFIDVDSQSGQGSRFTIYFPANDENIADTAMENSGGPRQAMTGSETILLVEDEGMFLEIISTQLRKSGFNVLAAPAPAAAMRAAADHDGLIHLLITDVMMPETCGPELADNLKALYPDMKCLFMSGYAEDIVTQQGKLPKDVEIISKPFSIGELTLKIRTMIGNAEK